MVRKLDKWCGIDWIIFICVTGVITAVCAALFWDNMPLGAQGAVFAAVIMTLSCAGGMEISRRPASIFITRCLAQKKRTDRI